MNRPEAEILGVRATALARAAVAAPADTVEVIRFVAAGQPCALELGWLREVRPFAGLAQLPFPAPGVLGVCHVRGRMLPVLDPGHLLGLPPTASGAKLLVVGAAAAAFGLPVGDAVAPGALRPGELQRDASVLEGTPAGLVVGIAPDGSMVLDGAALLARADRSHKNTS